MNNVARHRRRRFGRFRRRRASFRMGRPRFRRSRRYRRRGRRGVSRPGLFGMLGKIVPAFAFLDQVTSDDRRKGAYNNLDNIGKLKTLVNNVFGNISGWSPFGGVQKFQQNLNPAGIANKYTYIGLGSIAAGMILRASPWKIPGMGRVLALGRKMLLPGIVGGFFDDSPPGGGYSPTSVLNYPVGRQTLDSRPFGSSLAN